MKGRIPRIRIEDYPAVKAHLDQFWDKIKDRADQGDTPYNLRNCAYLEEFSKPKIIYNDIAQTLSFALSKDGEFLNNTAYFFGSYDISLLSYLQAVLNSDLIPWYYRTIFVQLGEKAVRMFSIYVLKIPIPKKIVKIDNEDAIYKIYGLNDQEVNFLKTRGH